MRPAVADRLTLAAAVVGCGGSLGLHLAVLAGAPVAPTAPWSWLLHAGTIVGFWRVAARIVAAGPPRLPGLEGFLRIRRMVPIPLRVAMAGATLNAVVAVGLWLRGQAPVGRALSAYWVMMYLLITIVFACVAPRVRVGEASPAPSGGRP